MAILCFPLFTCFRADSQLFGWVTAIRLSPSYLAESHPNGWTAAIWLSHSNLAESQPFGWLLAIWLSCRHLAESQPCGWVPAIWCWLGLRPSQWDLAAKVGWLAGPLAQPAKCGCPNLKVAGNKFPGFPRFCNPACKLWFNREMGPKLKMFISTVFSS